MPDKPSIERKGPDVLLRVRVNPGSSRDAVRFGPDGVVHIRLSAVPEAGKANKALRRYLAKTLRVAMRDVELEAGSRSREKRLRIRGVEAGLVREQLKAASAGKRLKRKTGSAS